MMIISEDKKRVINIGPGILFSVYSTLETRTKKFNKRIPLAEQFLKSGICDPEKAMETARQFNMFRDELAKYDPDKAVYDMTKPEQLPPWNGKLSRVVTSCANLYTTDDGQDLLFEIVSILCYGAITGVKVSII